MGSQLGRKISVLATKPAAEMAAKAATVLTLRMPRRQMTAGGARVVGIQLAIGEAIPGHRKAAGRDHAEEDADQIERATKLPSRQAITAESNANGSANSVWLKRMSSRRWRIVFNTVSRSHAKARGAKNKYIEPRRTRRSRRGF